MKHKVTRWFSILLVLALFLPFPVNARAASAVTPNEQALFRLLNEDRARYGLSPLILDGELSNIARIKSQDMADNNYFAHTSPTYGNVRTMLSSFGVSYLAANENIPQPVCRTRQRVISLFRGTSPHHAVRLLYTRRYRRRRQPIRLRNRHRNIRT